MKSCSYCGAQYPDDVQVCPQDQQPLHEQAPKQGAPPKTGTTCPGCGAVDDYSFTVNAHRSFSWGIFLLGGIFAVMFHNAGQRHRVRCNKCDARFYVCSPLSKLWIIIYWLLIGPAVIALTILLIDFVVEIFFR